MRDIDAVVFDMDGLMIDSEKIVMHSWNVVGTLLGYGEAMGENIVHTLGLNKAGRERYFKNLYGENFPFEKFYKLEAETFNKFVEKHGIPVKKGLYELIDFLKEHKIKIAVATSSSRKYAENVLKAKNIMDKIDYLISGDMVNHSKPDPEIYQIACEKLSVLPKKAVALEDSPNGIRSAYLAGLHVIMIPDFVPCNKEIRSMIVAEYDSLYSVIDFLEGYEHVWHNFEPIYNKESEILILGSFPSVKSRKGQFYYHHPQNRFWKVLSQIWKEEVPNSIEEKKSMLIRNHIAVFDVIESCDIIGSSDSSIKNVKVANLGEILKTAKIRNIYVNGGKAESLYKKHCEPLTKIKAIKLPSTSPANAAWSLERLIDAWSVIKKEETIKVIRKV